VTEAAKATADPPAEERFGGALAAIRQRRDQIIREGGHLDLLVPGYQGNLKVRYRDLSDTEHDEMAKRFERARNRDDTQGERESGADILIKHCERIYVREPGAEEFQELEENGDPFRFDKRLGALLGLGSETAREVVLDVFSPSQGPRRRHPDAIAPHIEAIFAWRQGREEEIDRRLLGE
jgi:hypothetical protein